VDRSVIEGVSRIPVVIDPVLRDTRKVPFSFFLFLPQRISHVVDDVFPAR